MWQFGSTVVVVLLVQLSIESSQDIYDVRIHEGADRGSRLTMSAELQRATEPLGHCFGQLETDVEWIEWRSSRGAFYTSTQMPLSVTKKADNLLGTLHLLCAGNQMHTFPFRVHITHRNHHPPKFSQSTYRFNVPMSLPIGSPIGKLEVHDLDPVIYNSERKLSLTRDETLVEIGQDGTLRLKRELVGITPYTPQRMQVVAIDYGSPQLYAIANVTLVPVTVTAPREPRVNVASDTYQIFEWEKPEYGDVNKYRLAIKRHDQIVYEEEIEAIKTVALTKIKLVESANTTFQITAIDENGETSSDWEQIGPIDRDLKCNGECSRGGTPLCYFGSFNRVEQFVDAKGSHCQCFPGFIGVSCETVDRCPAEKTIEGWGGIDWKEVNSNTSLRLPCPYNQPTENQFIERKCTWNEEAGRAQWDRPIERDRCTLQTSILAHLGMMGTFSAKATSVSAVNTVTQFVRKLLRLPTFTQNISKYAHFDQKIAEMSALVIDSILQTNLDLLPGNTSILRSDTWSVIDDLSSSLPVPYALSSPDNGLHMKAIEWTRRTGLNDNRIGGKCRVQLPAIDDEDRVVRVICATNATLFELLEPKSPILSIKTDEEDSWTRGGGSRIAIFLKYPDTIDNYTCVFYDEAERAWSTRGIRRVEHNYHGGYVKCETDHMGVFALLPDRLFYTSATFWGDLAAHLPTVTSFVTLICAILLLFMAAVQKNQPIDCAFLFYLFFIFMLHLVHLLLFLAPQVGEPFQFTTTLHFVLQYCVIAASGLLSLVLFSIHSTIVSYDVSKEDDDGSACFSRPFHVFLLGIFLPFLFTFSTYYFTDGRDVDIIRIFERIDWLFISNYLLPVVIFFSIAIVYAVWNIYIASGTKNNRRCTSDRLLALGPAISASLTCLFMILFFCSTLVLFFFREQSSVVVFLFCLCQFFHVISSFFFASYLFRHRFLLQRGFDTLDSTQSLERKRDISRALLEHVDTKSDVATTSSERGCDGGFGEAGFTTINHQNGATTPPPPPMIHHYQYNTPPSSHDYIPDNGANGGNGRYLTLHHNIFERAPMVSIV